MPRAVFLVLVALWIVSGPAEPLAAQTQDADQVAPQKQEQRPRRRVKRAPRPTFEREDWADVFFDDLFAEGLRGPRPSAADGPPAPTNNSVANDSPEATNENAATAGSWSAVIPAAVLEDEIKRQLNELTNRITNPGRFATEHREAGSAFQMLALMFGIISQFDGDVRWRDEAIPAAAAMAGAAVQSRQSGREAFQNARQTLDRLAGLARGESIGPQPGAGPIEDWSTLAERTTIMKRLQANLDVPLKNGLADSDAFSSEAESVTHEAAIIAAMSRVLQAPGMPDAEDDSYRALAEEMAAAALQLSEATARGQFEEAAAALNRVTQSCDNCHADWQ